MSRYTYDYYNIPIPGDLSDDPHVLCEQAITEARENSRIYAMPATWTARIIKGEVGDFEVIVRVTRKRMRTK